MNLNMKVTKILYHWFLLLDQFRFCETHFTTYQRFVADRSAHLGVITDLTLRETKFQRFLRGQSIFLNSKFQIREFHAECME